MLEVSKKNFDNTHAPVARQNTIRMIISKAVREDLKILQLGIPTAFLNGKLKSNVQIPKFNHFLDT